MAAKDVGEAEWNPASGTSDTWDGLPLEDSGGARKSDGLPL